MGKGFVKNIIKNNRGQAVLEYVLLTFIVVVVLGHILAGLAFGTQKFAQNYFGDYFQCLLETGELPTLGSDRVPNTECDETHEPFTFREGRPVVFNELSGPSDKFPNGSENVDTSQSDSDSASSGGSGSAGGDGGPGSAAGAGGGMGGSFADGFGGRNQKVPLSAADKKGKGAGAQGSVGGTGGLNNFEQAEEFGEDGTGRSSYVPIYGQRQLDDEEKKSDDLVKATVEQNPEQTLRGKRVPVSVTVEEKKSSADEDMTLPDFIKILIIAAIILVILIFFGGQVMNYSKSQE